jgi:hypothetical protein
LIVVAFALLGVYSSERVLSYRSGITGATNSPNDGGYGCTCHSTNANSATVVTITGPSGETVFTPGKSYKFTVTVTNANERGAGVNVATDNGTLVSGPGLGSDGSELYHTTPKTLVSGSASWTFTYTAPTGVDSDIIYATGNAVNLDGSADGADRWNFAPIFVVHLEAAGVSNVTATSSDMSLSISPNPARSGAVIYLSSVTSTHGRLSVYDASGRSVFETQPQEYHAGTNSVYLETSGMRSGEYFARLLTDAGQPLAATKLIVAH